MGVNCEGRGGGGKLGGVKGGGERGLPGREVNGGGGNWEGDLNCGGE